MRRRTTAALLALALAGCGGTAGSPLPTPDAGDTTDASASPDTGAPHDAGAEDDAGVEDTGALPDGGLPEDDAGTQEDAGSAEDAGFTDAGFPEDAGPPDAGQPAVADPEVPGPYTVGSYAETYRVPATFNQLPLDCRYPTAGPSAGPFPAVLIGHGFQISADQYLGYAEHLASFGFVACTADFRAGFIANHAENATDMIGGMDWLEASAADPTHALGGIIDPTRLGIMGHSLGGKVAFLTAARDSRIGAVLGVDPVDSAPLCNSTRCPDASDTLPYTIPVGLLGETLDASGGAQPCAPAADNFQTFYDASDSPAVEVDVLGASHVSFVDDPATCGFACTVCATPTADHADVLRVARAVTAAFFLLHLEGDPGYETYLSGAAAQTRYVQTGLAAIRSK